ncbi:MAG: CSLREA domain-containing protein, partial [Dehalococcoidia bacterium]
MPAFFFPVFLALAFLLAAVFTAPAAFAQEATFSVDTTADAVDANPGDGACATEDGSCTLRAAIQEGNAQSGPQSI